MKVFIFFSLSKDYLLYDAASLKKLLDYGKIPDQKYSDWIADNIH